MKHQNWLYSYLLRYTRLVQKVEIMDLLSTDNTNLRWHNTASKYCPWTATHFCHQLYSSWKHHWKSFSWRQFRAAVIASFTSSMLLKYHPFSRHLTTLKKWKSGSNRSREYGGYGSVVILVSARLLQCWHLDYWRGKCLTDGIIQHIAL
jgi:hypothetical protein